MSPRVSVVLPVYNGAPYVGAAIESVLAQTFADFELIVIDDGSTDGTGTIVAANGDPRIRLVRQENRGLSLSLNRAIAMARGEYVARQDHDDVSRPTRLAQQVAYMDAHSDCGLLGTRADIVMDSVSDGRAHEHPLSDGALRFELLFYNPFVHSSVMIRRSVLERAGGYRVEPPEDYELWSRMSRVSRVANLRDHLVVYREVPRSLSRLAHDPYLHGAVQQSQENLAHFFGEASATKDMRDLAALMHGVFDRVSAKPDLPAMLALLQRAANCCDPAGTNQELTTQLKLRSGTLRRRYRRRGALAQVLVRHAKAARRWASVTLARRFSS